MNVLAALCVVALAAAQERPSEDAMFGEAPAADAGAPSERLNEDAMFGAANPLAAGPSDAGSASTDRDNQQLSGAPAKDRFDTNEEKSDPLRVGGTLYIRGSATALDARPPSQWSFSAPSLLDVYLDARPIDRVRGFALGRLRYDASLNSSVNASFLPSSTPVLTSNPSVALDQLWLRFDILQKVFMTVGRQKVKWGTGRLWNPTDFLNAQRRDPLQPFDLRLGINAVKVHVPVESLGWNFYGFGLLDNNGPASVLGQLGGALRAEFVFGKTEIALDGAWVRGRRPRYGVEISSALGPIDAYGEMAFRSGNDLTTWRINGSVDPNNPFSTVFEQYTPGGIQLQGTAGLSWTFNYTDQNTITLGAEYHYNPTGASNPALYGWLIFQGAYTPFYAGQHYLGIFALAPQLPRFNWITLNMTNLLNLSDPSGILRFDAFFRVLTYLQFEAFVSVNYGVKGGEFRFGLDVPALNLPDGTMTPPINVQAPVASAGLGLRISI